MPDRTRYHRLVGWHAPRLRRVGVTLGIGGVAAVISLPIFEWELALLIGWDVAAILFLAASWNVILRADGRQTEQLATTADETRRTAAALVLSASVASLLAIGVTLRAAGDQHGWGRTASIIGALVTVVASWNAVNTMFTLRYTDQHYRARSAVPGFDFGYEGPDDRPDYRDFAYVAYTIGMCYQVSDTTLRSRHIRRTVLVHSVISYVFGVVIIAAGINLIAGLIS